MIVSEWNSIKPDLKNLIKELNWLLFKEKTDLKLGETNYDGYGTQLSFLFFLFVKPRLRF